jgi:fatty acid desaturase
VAQVPAWNPLSEWRHQDIPWVKVKISPEDLRRFTTRSNVRGLAQALGFLALLGATGTLAGWAFLGRHWLVMAVALYAHGTFYSRFGDALHELSHNTVFASRWLNVGMTALYGWLFWPWNPHLYRLSHQGYHHRYTLHQGSDGEDVPNYVRLTPRLVVDLFFRVIHVRALVQNLARLVTLKPTSLGWRGRAYPLDTWEQFILQRATEKQRRQVYRFGLACLVTHIPFVLACVWAGHPYAFLPVLITFAPFYGAGFLSFIAGTHQHAACEANHPDFRVSCGDAILDPFSSFLYWHMEYHIEHHMFAGIPCYNLKAFSRFVADQMPPKEHALPRLLKLHRVCQEKYGSWQNWRDRFGRYKGF